MRGTYRMPQRPSAHPPPQTHPPRLSKAGRPYPSSPLPGFRFPPPACFSDTWKYEISGFPFFLFLQHSFFSISRSLSAHLYPCHPAPLNWRGSITQRFDRWRKNTRLLFVASSSVFEAAGLLLVRQKQCEPINLQGPTMRHRVYS